MDRKFSVSQCVLQIKTLLEGEFRNITIEGEVTNLTSSSTGHWYFSLSDRDSSLSSALFKMDAFRNPLIKKIKNGDKIICMGSIGVYTKRGTFQIIVRKILPAGKGDLNELFEALKRKLSSEGLFDLERKKPINELPKKIAIITAAKGAALQDFLNIYKRRSLWMDILLVPALVQGDGAAPSMRKALALAQQVHKKKPLDAIILTRGGGSLEDLWAFNDEQLARDIAACPVPIVSAVGHQVDFSICDFVADLRCETPSSAAEVLTEKQVAVGQILSSSQQRLQSAMQVHLSSSRQQLVAFNPQQLSDKLWQLFKNAYEKLDKLNLTHRLVELTGFHETSLRMDELSHRLNIVMKDRMNNLKFCLTKNEQLLHALSPHRVLERGYSYTVDCHGSVVSSIQKFTEIGTGESLKVHFSDGVGEVLKK